MEKCREGREDLEGQEGHVGQGREGHVGQGREGNVGEGREDLEGQEGHVGQLTQLRFLLLSATLRDRPSIDTLTK